MDLYAPGSYIMSSLYSGGLADPRNASYQVGKYSGTSMATPQVCGMIACLLEQYPNWNQTRVNEYIKATCKVGQLNDTGGGYTDTSSLQGSANRYLYYTPPRALDEILEENNGAIVSSQFL